MFIRILGMCLLLAVQGCESLREPSVMRSASLPQPRSQSSCYPHQSHSSYYGLKPSLSEEEYERLSARFSPPSEPHRKQRDKDYHAPVPSSSPFQPDDPYALFKKKIRGSDLH